MGKHQVDCAPVTTVVLSALLTGLALGVTACAKNAGSFQSSGMTYASLQSLPDFSGWWYWDVAPEKLFALSLQAPLKPDAAAYLKDRIGKFKSGKLGDPVANGEKPRYCKPPRFDGLVGGLGSDFEFLFTPGRVTLADEGGLVRRINLTNQPLPGDLDEMNSGTSVGHWEGQTLVVETGGLNSQLKWIGPFSFGHNVRVTERISLKGPDELVIAARITAPELFTAPYEVTSVYRRDRGHVFHEALSCVDDDRSVDPTTGRQRFDLTPPKDLPPPPSE